MDTGEGDVVRQTNLSDEQLAKYVKDQPTTVDGYTCSSTDPKGPNGGMDAHNNNVEMRIVSKTGKEVGQYGGTPDEVQFKDHTNFFVHDKYWDPKLNRTVIIMEEI